MTRLQRQSRKKLQKRDPEETRRKLLGAAAREFASKGLEGARVDAIAARARVNKQLVYHYFKSKEGLYVAALERAYTRIRQREESLAVELKNPKQAMAKLASLFLDYFVEMPDEIAIISDENVHRGRHVARSEKIKGLGTSLVALVEQILARGGKEGHFRTNVDAKQLIVLMLGMSSIYVSNNYTLSALYERNLRSPRELKQWRACVIDFVLRGLRP